MARQRDYKIFRKPKKKITAKYSATFGGDGKMQLKVSTVLLSMALQFVSIQNLKNKFIRS